MHGYRLETASPQQISQLLQSLPGKCAGGKGAQAAGVCSRSRVGQSDLLSSCAKKQH